MSRSEAVEYSISTKSSGLCTILLSQSINPCKKLACTDFGDLSIHSGTYLFLAVYVSTLPNNSCIRATN